MSTDNFNTPQNPVEYIVAARAGLKTAGMATSMQVGEIPILVPIISAIITAQAIDRQTEQLKAIGDELINAVKNVAGK